MDFPSMQLAIRPHGAARGNEIARLDIRNVFLTLSVIRVAAVTCIVDDVPSGRAKEIDFPSKDLMVPLIVGVLSRGSGAWANAGKER